MKVYVVEVHGEPEDVFLDKTEAHLYAETWYGCHQDGVCTDGIVVVAYKAEPVNVS
jgi:hypothetical protein